jgi:hypothetical protein
MTAHNKMRRQFTVRQRTAPDPDLTADEMRVSIWGPGLNGDQVRGDELCELIERVLNAVWPSMTLR